ncbi:hypothetical protein [Butyrivibrio sp. MC2021]|nr:hypothetical protein [Butyrivibrio sp. MC2021]
MKKSETFSAVYFRGHYMDPRVVAARLKTIFSLSGIVISVVSWYFFSLCK